MSDNSALIMRLPDGAKTYPLIGIWDTFKQKYFLLRALLYYYTKSLNLSSEYDNNYARAQLHF